MNRPASSRAPQHAPHEQEDARESPDHVPSGGAIDQQAARWLLRQRDGFDAGEQVQFEHWRTADPAHAEALARHQALGRELDALPAAGRAALEAGLPRHTAPPLADAGRRAWWGRAARWLPQAGVAALLCAVVGAGWWGRGWWQQQPVFSQRYATARGELRAVSLPDGSTLQLDTATLADVTLYRDRREVRLREGQALFDVQRDAARRFEVEAGPVRITVVGTRFSVRHMQGNGDGDGDGDRGVRVAVEDGRVSVRTAAHAPAGILLSAGQLFEAGTAGQPGTVSTVARAGIAPWREGRVAFDDTPLAQALAELERYGDTRLRILDPAVGALRISGSFDARRAEHFAQAIQRVLPVRLQARDGVAEIVLIR